MKLITTHEELMQLHGRRVTCTIKGITITDARISVDDDDYIYICQNDTNGGVADDKLGYKYSWRISYSNSKYENHNRECADIILVEQEEYTEKNKRFFNLFAQDGVEIFYLKKGKPDWYRKDVNEKIDKYYYDFIVIVKDGIPNAMPVPVFYTQSSLSIKEIKEIKKDYSMNEESYKKRFKTFYDMINL